MVSTIGARVERRDVPIRSSRDRLARWLELHPANLGTLPSEAVMALNNLLETARLGSENAQDLFRELLRLKETAAELDQLARVDILTAVANRRAVEEKVNEEWERAVRYRRPLAVLLVDVDHLKAINDRHGHAAGDRLLRAVADRLKAVLRGGDMLGRVGGDEFVVICPETDAAAAQQLADRLMQAAVADPLDVEDMKLSISLSIGWAVRESERQPQELLRAADDALYRAKAEGRGRSLGR
ncbi:MAG: hypothetical protein QOE92_1122 [Chloroflexota bacterium]|jgi:diguanylate cyclase (GGDEF)-like protein|nr:hypothetical protein [Chloroflexota bacterium]